MRATTITRLSIVACSLLIPNLCEAGGMFRRVPEVGEWARYEFSGEQTIQHPEKGMVNGASPPGTLDIKCVGEETIDEVRHMWIEAVLSIPENQTEGNPTVVKYRVPEDEVMGGISTCHFERGWFKVDGRDVAAFEREEPNFNQAWINVLTMLPHVESPVAADVGRTIEVAGKEIELLQSEVGQIADLQIAEARDRIAGDCAFWPNPELAFGVGSVEQTWKWSADGEFVMEMKGTFDLVATGTDAVSELPDHN